MISVYGIDHRSGSLEDRERLSSAIGTRSPEGRHFFVTCNRFESYGPGGSPGFDYRYDHHGEREVYKHLLALACGLKSQLLGERQIMDQLDLFSGTVDARLGGMITQVISEARRIREKYSLNTLHTVADAVYRNVLGRGLLGEKTIVVGTGAVAGMVAERFSKDSPLCFVSGKHRKRAQDLAARFKAESVSRAELGRSLDGARVLICAASSPHYVITREHPVDGCVVYDLSVPRNVDPYLGAIDLERLGGEFEDLNREVGSRVSGAQREIERSCG